MKKETCKMCGRKTKAMVQMNSGLFCQEHWEIEVCIQETNLKIEDMRARYILNSWS